MIELFGNLSSAVGGGWLIAIPAAIVWGILSVLLSPCHLVSIPLIVAFIDEQGLMTTKRALWISTLFSIGILITIALIGVGTVSAGKMAGQTSGWVNYFVAGVFFLVGLHLIGILPLPFSGPSNLKLKRKGALAAFLLGLIFGLALGPCTFAYMAPILVIAFSQGAERLGYGILLMTAYGLGHCTVIIFAGTFAEIVQKYMDWNEKSKATETIKKTCGVLVLLAGLYMIYIAR